MADQDPKTRGSKDSFWHFARRMLRYRFLFAMAMVMVLTSGLSLGMGMIGALPILRSIVGENVPGEGQELPDLATRLNQKLATLPWPLPHPQLSQAFIAQLPSGRMTAVVWVMGVLVVI